MSVNRRVFVSAPRDIRLDTPRIKIKGAIVDQIKQLGEKKGEKKRGGEKRDAAHLLTSRMLPDKLAACHGEPASHLGR